MHLKKVTLNNFRCFESLDLVLHPKLTVLVGENGAGKTAILDGIATALTPVLTYLSSANQRLSGRGITDADFRLVAVPGQSGAERWRLVDYAQVVAETTDGKKWDYWRPSGSGVEEPKDKIGLVQLKSYVQAIIENYKSDTPVLTPVFAYYGARRGYIKIPERLRESKENYEFPTSALMGALDAMSDFKELLKWFDGEEAAELRANRGLPPGEYQASAQLQAVRNAIESLLGGDFKNPYFNRGHKFVIESAQGGPPLQVNQLSQGYQSMLALAMDFSRRLALANRHMHDGNTATEDATGTAPAIMLVDEVDLHLHPSWQQRVLGDLLRTFPNTQFIVTTHSPQVLTTVPSECVRILKDGKIFAAPAGTEGAEPARLLKQVLGLKDVRPLANQATQELKEYLALVDKDQWGSPRAMALRQILDARYQGNEPELLEADLQIENRKWELDA